MDDPLPDNPPALRRQACGDVERVILMSKICHIFIWYPRGAFSRDIEDFPVIFSTRRIMRTCLRKRGEQLESAIHHILGALLPTSLLNMVQAYFFKSEKTNFLRQLEMSLIYSFRKEKSCFEEKGDRESDSASDSVSDSERKESNKKSIPKSLFESLEKFLS